MRKTHVFLLVLIITLVGSTPVFAAEPTAPASTNKPTKELIKEAKQAVRQLQLEAIEARRVPLQKELDELPESIDITP